MGSREWEESLHRNPTYVRNTILSLVREAAGGRKQSVEDLAAWLQRYPEMRSLVRQLADLAEKVEQAWVVRLCGVDEVSKLALREELAAMRAGLLGPAPSVADKVLVGTVIVAYLAYQRAAVLTAQSSDQADVRAAQERLLTTAQKRLQDAVKAWTTYARTKAKGVRPRGDLKLFAPDAEAV